MSREFEWHERGTGLELHLEPGLVRVELVDDGERHSAVFAPTILGALVDQLEGHEGCVPEDEHEDKLADLERAEAEKAAAQAVAASLEGDLARAEHERDEAIERASHLEAELRARLGDLETLKSAGAMSDQRVRGLERDVERMRAAGLSLDDERTVRRVNRAIEARS